MEQNPRLWSLIVYHQLYTQQRLCDAMVYPYIYMHILTVNGVHYNKDKTVVMLA